MTANNHSSCVPNYQEKHDLNVSTLVEELARQIEPVLRDSNNPCLVGIQRRGDLLATRIVEHLSARSGLDIPLGALDITLYRDDFDSLTQAPIVGHTDIPFSVDGRTIVLVDDVLFTGRTIRAALDELLEFGRPDRVLLAVLVDRGWRELPIAADFVGCYLETGRNDTVQVLIRDLDERDAILQIPAGE